MPGPKGLHRAVCLLAVAAFCVFFLPRAAAADSTHLSIQSLSDSAGSLATPLANVAITGSGVRAWSDHDGRSMHRHHRDHDDPPVNCPEPSSIAMLGLGLVGFFIIRRRSTPFRSV